MVQSDDHVEATHLQIQLAILEWEDLLRITGGCVVPYKSAWYLFNYEWRQGKWKFTNPGEHKVLKDINKAGQLSPL